MFVRVSIPVQAVKEIPIAPHQVFLGDRLSMARGPLSFPKIISGRIGIDPERRLATNAPREGFLMGTLVAPPSLGERRQVRRSGRHRAAPCS